MKIALIVFASLVVLLVGFVVWRWTSVVRGASERDEKLFALLGPIAERIENGQVLALGEIATLAAKPEIRHMLFYTLRRMKKTELLPNGCSSSIAQGESALAYWLMHPNELGGAPAAIEFVETVQRPVDGRNAEFHVYRFKTSAGHWAEKDGWLLGLAGPMQADAEPYAEMPGAFSRIDDLDGTIKPAELVDWYIDALRQKGAIK